MGANDVPHDAADFPVTGVGISEPYTHLVHAGEAFEFAPDPQLRTDGHGIILKGNHAAATLLYCPKEFLVGKPLGLFVAEGYRGRFYVALSRLWQGVANSDSFETRITRRRERPKDVAVAVMSDRRADADADREVVNFHWRMTDVTVRKQAESARDDLLRRLVTAEEDERRRVSRELHDSVGQMLTALTFAIETVRETTPLSSLVAARLGEVRRLVDELGRIVRDLSIRLRPPALDDIGLHAALSQHLAGWTARTGVEVDYFAAAVETERLPTDIETAVYRVVQEALTNVARHARARRVSVVISRHEETATVAVEDDGVGFDPEAAMLSGRLGLIGMRERAALAGGTLEVESIPGQGTTILARFNLNKMSDSGGVDLFLGGLSAGAGSRGP